MSFYHAFSLLRHFALSNGFTGKGNDDPYISNMLQVIRADAESSGYILAASSARTAMLADRREVLITDLGTGGRSGQLRRICDIAAASSLSHRYGAMLARLVASEFKDEPDTGGIILELGTSLGISTLYMAAAAPHRRLVTVEGCAASVSVAVENFRNSGFSGITAEHEEFSTALAKLKDEGAKVRFAFIDGNHTGDALEEYFNSIMEMSNGVFTIVADDIHNSRSMHRGWKKIKNDSRVMVSAETFRLGILTGSQSAIRRHIRMRC